MRGGRLSRLLLRPASPCWHYTFRGSVWWGVCMCMCVCVGEKLLWPQPNLLFNVAFALQPHRFPAPPRLPVLAREGGEGGRSRRCSFPLPRGSAPRFPPIAAHEEPFHPFIYYLFFFVFPPAVAKNRSNRQTLSDSDRRNPTVSLSEGQRVWHGSLARCRPRVCVFSASFLFWQSKAALRS